MASDINRVYLIGRPTKDPELSYTKNAMAMAKFSLASGRTFVSGDQKREETNFFNCIVWGKQAETLAEYLKKGKRVAVEGRLEQQTWEDDSGKKQSKIQVVVERFQFLDTLNKNIVEVEVDAPALDEEIPF